MNRRQTKDFAICTLILFFYQVGLAQFPGGISANLRAWYNAGTGITLTGGAVSQWNDQSGNAFNATQGTAGSRPTVTTSAINYNDALAFDGANDMLNASDLLATGTTGVSIFAVVRQTSTAGDNWGTIILGQSNSASWDGGGYGLTALLAGNTSFGFWIREWDVNAVSLATTLSSPALMTGSWNGTTANNVQYFQNGTSAGTDAYTPGSVGDGGATSIGSGRGSGTEFCFQGHIAEIALYNTGLSAANVQRVNSHLSLKYGITLNTDYVNTSGTTIFARTTTYTNNIIGIGREDASTLNQKQSRNSDDSTRVYISTLAASNSANGGSFASNVSFIITGANSGRLYGVTSEKPGTVYSRLDREWKVTNTNFASTFNMDIRLAPKANPSTVSTSDLRLLVDVDGDFSDATVYSSADGLTFSYSNPVVSIGGINTTMIPSGATRYITLASNAATTPLPVELITFTAEACNGNVCLQWKTASEDRNDRFEIERLTDGLAWEKIGQLKGKGSSKTENSYSFIDPLSNTGNAYYRLKQVDTDGEFSYSSIILVELQKSEIKVHPNPSDNLFIIEGAGKQDLILIRSASGKEVTESVIMKQLGDGKTELNTYELAGGIYNIEVFDGRGVRLDSKRIIIIR